MDSDQAGTQGASGSRVVTRNYLFNKMMEQNLPNFDEKLEFIEKYILSQEDYCDDQIKDVKHKFSYVKSQFKKRWLEAHKKNELFLKKNEQWLKGTFEIPKQKRRSTGRPEKSFEDSSQRSKRRKTELLRTVVDKNVLVSAAQSMLQNSGERIASNILKDIKSCPQTAQKYQKGFKLLKENKKQTQLEPMAALAIFVEADLSRRQYNIIQNSDKKRYPSYTKLQKAKNSCYPEKDAYNVTETCAEIVLQKLMDHTAKRLIQSLLPILQGSTPEELQSLTLISKWGCDGSNQTQYKQKMLDNETSDGSIFQSCFVPLQLVSSKTKVIWQNPTPSSPRYCRPIRIRFIKESVDVTQSEIEFIENQINHLQNSEISEGELICSVKHTLTLTMVDAKVCNAATSTTSTMRCYICGATSKEFNNLNKMRDIDTDALSFGLSVLHARIRFFESILHLAYKLPVAKWQVRSESDKDTVKQRKSEIQAKFRELTGLIVDVPKAGFGNTNDGNTSRRFFADPELASSITGVDIKLIKRLKVILEVISSGMKVNLNLFADYGYETAKLYVQLYPWHPMTPTLHKILIHGATVMKHALLPIGLLSEEAAEARNKHFRLYRQNFSRKFNRIQCNYDVINRLLLSSDPLVTGMRPKPKKRSLPFSSEALQMFISGEPNKSSDKSSSDESTDESEMFYTSDEDTWDSS